MEQIPRSGIGTEEEEERGQEAKKKKRIELPTMWCVEGPEPAVIMGLASTEKQ